MTVILISVPYYISDSELNDIGSGYIYDMTDIIYILRSVSVLSVCLIYQYTDIYMIYRQS